MNTKCTSLVLCQAPVIAGRMESEGGDFVALAPLSRRSSWSTIR